MPPITEVSAISRVREAQVSVATLSSPVARVASSLAGSAARACGNGLAAGRLSARARSQPRAEAGQRSLAGELRAQVRRGAPLRGELRVELADFRG